MPRAARLKSSSGIYHIVLRGINRQLLFEEEADKFKFLEILKNYKIICGYKIFAYCLMSNHIHLLLQENEEKLEKIFKRIGSKYVYWFNCKYQRTGHLFQDRFKSEPIDDEEYLLNAAVYIHQNPVNAGISRKIEEYQWSSFKQYAHQEAGQIVDTDFILDKIDIDSFIQVNNEAVKEKFLETEQRKNNRYTDEQGKDLIKRIANCNNATEFQKLEPDEKKQMMSKLKDKGLSIRQISRLTGINYTAARKS